MIRTHSEARSPHIICIAASSIIGGLLQIAFIEPPANLQHSAAIPIGLTWSALALVGGICVIVGAYMKDIPLGLHVEGAGHIGLTFGWGTYAMAAIFYMTTPWYVSPAVWWAIGLAIASAARAYRIHRVMLRAPRC